MSYQGSYVQLLCSACSVAAERDILIFLLFLYKFGKMHNSIDDKVQPSPSSALLANQAILQMSGTLWCTIIVHDRRGT